MRGVKAEGGVSRERPLRRGPSWSTHLKLLGYEVTRAATRGHCQAIRNPNGKEAGRTVNGTAKIVDEQSNTESSKRVRGLAASTAVLLLDRRQSTGKGGEGRPEELEAEQRRKQSFSGEAEVTGSGAEAGRSTSQEETNPAGHGGRGRGGYAQEARRASEGDIGAQRASGKVRDSGIGDRTCREGASSECSPAWDRNDLLRGPLEISLEERQDSLSSDVGLFSPERKEGSGGVERGRVSEESDLCSPVKRRCGGFQIVWVVNEPGSDSIGKAASDATHELESEEET